jgi:hypothetical protein
VDFLNEQLAMREMQLNEKERQLLYLKELQGEFEYRFASPPFLLFSQ